MGDYERLARCICPCTAQLLGGPPDAVGDSVLKLVINLSDFVEHDRMLSAIRASAKKHLGYAMVIGALPSS